MSVFVDTSALLAILDHLDAHHNNAKNKWQQIAQMNATLICTNYVIVESIALMQKRLGMQITQRFQQGIVPVLEVVWVEEQLHNVALVFFLTANRRKLSFVDCVSFATMRQKGVDRFFAFDQHFIEQGFVPF